MGEIRVYSEGKKHRERNEARLERNKEIAEINAKYRKRLQEEVERDRGRGEGMKLTICQVSNGALMKTDMNKNETESGEREQSEKVFVFDEEKPEGIIDMLNEIFNDVLFIGGSNYDKESDEFVCRLIRVHGRKYDVSQCQPRCVLCRNTKLLEDFRNACSKEKA